MQEIQKKERIPCKMQPQKMEHKPQAELFKVELERLVDSKHSLVRLAGQINWQAFDEKFEKYFTSEGRPAIETRLMVSMHYLKYMYDLSDEETVSAWVENPYWQYFSGRQYFEHVLPIDPSSMTRWRRRIGPKILHRQQNYAHAQQGRRAARETRKLKTLLRRVLSDIERKAEKPSKRMIAYLKLGQRLMKQKRNSKKKLYSIHEPQVECIAKGKVHQRYEFGNKVGFVVSGTGNWILGAKSFVENPFDGHTLKTSIEQAEQMTGEKIKQATCDLGYRGHGVKKVNVLIVPRNKKKASRTIRRWWKRRNAIEPIIGHEKSEHRLERNQLSGELGDSLNVILSACGFNLKKLVRAFCAWIEMAEKVFWKDQFCFSEDNYGKSTA